MNDFHTDLIGRKVKVCMGYSYEQFRVQVNGAGGLGKFREEKTCCHAGKEGKIVAMRCDSSTTWRICIEEDETGLVFETLLQNIVLDKK